MPGMPFFCLLSGDSFANLIFFDMSQLCQMNTGLSINGALHEVPGTSVGTTVGLRHTF
ncbi:hypothetical protein [Burkholderia sp. BCC1993]|uniref:hypothetical protein n=1 Tax=Burkholderia sp. BCC1993 TaxID=2817444 RepID=UPI002AB2D0B4|nr:hypothetical protein [Burkholderia sp. BCC1993]